MSNSPISVCALMLDPYDTVPGQRFRVEQWEPYLKQDGISLEYFPFTNEALKKVIYQPGELAAKIIELSKAFVRRINHVLQTSKYDAVLIYRAASMIGPAILEKYLHRRGLPIIYDFDDAIFLTNTSKANERFGWTKFAGKTAEICRLSTTVTVGNSYLADFARQHNQNVYVVPSSIDTNRYQMPPPKAQIAGKRVVIGWTGSSTSQYHLETFEPVLAELLKERDVEIRVISDREPAFTQIPFVWRKWSQATEVRETAEIDVGIMPLPDDEWARGKCAMKALIYMSLGIPAICSAVGANREVVADGANGFLAATPAEWLTKLKILIDNADLRRSFGGAARQTIVDRYSMTSCSQLFAEAVRDAVRIKQSQAAK